MKILHNGANVYTDNLQLVEILHPNLAFYNVTSIHGFTLMLNVVCANTIIIWISTTASKKELIRIIIFILKTLNNQQLPYNLTIVNEYETLEKPTDITDLYVDEFNTAI